MADANKVIKFIKKWEGGYANDPDDSGGCTMMGITIKTYQKYFGNFKTCDDLKNIKDDEWRFIFNVGFWNKIQGYYIDNQSIALLCTQMCWGSGTVTAIKKIQEELGLKVDGICGPDTLAALNSEDTKKTFDRLWLMRYNWLHSIAARRPKTKKFLKGWLRRLSDIKYEE